jgi:hypothetical protein
MADPGAGEECVVATLGGNGCVAYPQSTGKADSTRHRGFLQVVDNQVTVLSESAQAA